MIINMNCLTLQWKIQWPIKQFHIFDLSLEWIQWHIIIPQRSLWLLRDIFLWINRRQTPMIGVYLLLDLFPVQCFSLNRTTHAQCGTHGCQDCRCKVPQKLNKPRFVLLSHFSTDFHWLIIKFIITDLILHFLGTEIHGVFVHRLSQINTDF